VSSALAIPTSWQQMPPLTRDELDALPGLRSHSAPRSTSSTTWMARRSPPAKAKPWCSRSTGGRTRSNYSPRMRRATQNARHLRRRGAASEATPVVPAGAEQPNRPSPGPDSRR
jgi:hypothetical protein